MISRFTLLICSLLLKWRHKQECLQQLHSFISQTLQRLQASLVQSLLTGHFWRNHSWVTTFPQLLLHRNTAHEELRGFMFKSQRLLLIYMEYIRDETWKKKIKSCLPFSVQQNQIVLLGLPFLWQGRQRSTHFSVFDRSLGIQDLGRAFLISATRNIAFEVQSYIFKKRVLILVLQEVEMLQ